MLVAADEVIELRCCFCCGALVRFWQIVLQKSPSRLCEIEICNNRIGASVLLNRCCSFVPDLESMFRDQMQKILLQHNRHKADMRVVALDVRLRGQSGHSPRRARSPLLMLWTAPTLRHRSAIGWLRRNAPLEGSRPWARLARSV